MSSTAMVQKEDLCDILILSGLKGFGPQKFKALHEDGIHSSEVLHRPTELERFGKLGRTFIEQLRAQPMDAKSRAKSLAERLLNAAKASNAAILTYADDRYPKCLYLSNNPVPIMYARGDLDVLGSARAVACVGSRKIRRPYSDLHGSFVRNAVREGVSIISGFATGADIIGHEAAVAAGGSTVCVMPSGLDRPFPPEHKEVWQRFLHRKGVVFVSEFGFGTGANSLNLRKRNKTIVGMAKGVLISQSSDSGGAMNAYRFAIEQKKPVATFEANGSSETSGNALIANAPEKARATVLTNSGGEDWTRWLQSL